MAEEKPSPVTFHEYDIPAVNKWFAWSSALLLVVSVWMIWADYSREWKGYARRFRDVEVVRTQSAIRKADGAIDQKELAAVRAQLAAGEQARSAHRQEIDKLQAEKGSLEGKWYAADQAYRFIKAELDVARYEIEEARAHRSGVAAAQAKFDRTQAETEKRRLEFEDVDQRKRAIEARIATIDKTRDDAAKEQERLYADKTRLEGRLAKIGHSGAAGFVNDYFRDRPLVDFLAPQYKVQQAVLPAVHQDVNFLTVPRVDRCQTCHAAIDKPGFTDSKELRLAPEFRTHPRLDLLLGRNHPIEKLGCTGCHAGSGLAITFVDAAHTPNTSRQSKDWEAKRDWHALHHWDYPMLPLRYAESGCVNCHNQETRVPGADRLNAGRELIESYGCFGCHKIDRPGWDELRKVGPELAHVGAKVSKEWMYKWVKDPKGFRPTTRMPRFWGNSNTAAPAPTMNYPLRDDVEAEAVVRYLLARSKPYPALARPSDKLVGDPVRGKWVVDNRGCKACHVVGADDTGEGRYGARFGPELSQVGSKLSRDWLYAWIQDPKSVWPDTRMPNLRLSEQESLDATVYLLSLKNPGFEAKPLPDLTTGPARKMLEDVSYEYLRKETTTAEAKDRLGKMDDEARYAYLGQKLIGRYGCFGCHDNLPGFENAQRIGTELTTWASKLLTQLDYGLTDVPRTKHDWLRAKLLDPRTYDHGKVATKDPQDLLKMPNFQLTEEQADLIMTVVLGFQRDYVQPEGHRRLDFAQSAMEKGRRVIHNRNCQGCHVIENLGGGMEKVVEGGKPFAPPVLVASFQIPDGPAGKTEEGARVQPDWLFQFLNAPTPIRPWLNLRMPTFGLADGAATDVVEYFAAHAEATFPYSSFDPEALPEAQVAEGKRLFEKYGCIKCHLPLEEAKQFGYTAADLAPNLELAKHRLRYEWLEAWLTDPQVVLKDTKMPGFFFYWDSDAKKYVESLPGASGQIDAIRAYLQYHGAPRPPIKVAVAPRGR